MKLKTCTLIVLAGILFISCSNKKTSGESSQDNVEQTQPQYDAKTYLIKEKTVGSFQIDGSILSQINDWTIKKEVQTRYTEEGDEEYLTYIVSENGQKMLSIDPKYDYNTGKYLNDIAGEIMIFSDKFKTEEGIGVGSFIGEFTEKYPDYELWYTYVSDSYVLDRKSQIGQQFLLDPNDFIGDESKLYGGDMVTLKPSDFKEGSKIKKIRIF